MPDPRALVGSPAAGRITDPEQLHGGAVLILKAARAAGGWFAWATIGTVTKPVKTVAASESGDGKARYEDRRFTRHLVKGRHLDGRAFVVQYVEEKIEGAYVLTHEHWTEVDGELVEWRTDRPTFDRASVAIVKKYLATP